MVVMVDDAGFEPPKYAQIVAAIRRRIADGTYPPGSLLPSESKLVKEFGVSRPTVVRALEALKLRGEIDREHGRGSFVKAAPLPAEDAARPVRSVLDRAEADETGWTTSVERCPAPTAIASLLGLAEAVPLVLRRRLTIADDAPYELVSLWLPVELAETAGLDQDTPLTASVRQLVQSATGRRFGHVAERLTARHPTPEEAEQLAIPAGSPVFGVLSTVFDTAGRAVLVAELVLPGELHELTDSYAL
jgi:DNA-binding GntR family transcriptional regulator